MPFHTPGNLPDPGIETVSLSFSALTGGFLTTSALEKPTSIFFRWYYFLCLSLAAKPILSQVQLPFIPLANQNSVPIT